MRSRLHPIPWALALAGMLALSYRLSDGSVLGVARDLFFLAWHPVPFLLLIAPFPVFILLCLGFRASRGVTLGLSLAALGLTVPVVVLAWLTRDAMGLKDDNIGMGLIPLVLFVQWPLVAAVGFCWFATRP